MRRYILVGAIWSGICSVGFAQAPTAPEAVWASATNETEFTASWSEVTNAAEYRLDVSQDPDFQDAGAVPTTIFRETMGTVPGTISVYAHETNNGFDVDGFTMSNGGVTYTGDVRRTSYSFGYTDPAGNAASSNANIYFALSPSGDRGFAIAGIDTRGSSSLLLSFGCRKEASITNMSFDLQYSTNGGGNWEAIAVSNMPATNAAVGWYMVSNLSLSAGAAGVTNLGLRWVKTGSFAVRLDDILLQGVAPVGDYVPGYSNRAVAGTGESVTGLTAGATYFFRVSAVSAEGTGAFSSVASVTTVSNTPASVPVFDAIGEPSGVVGMETGFAVNATGYPEPALALLDTTAAGAHDFNEATGALTYTPAEEDAGTQTFTFTASNTAGVATQAVGVAVYLPAAPVFDAVGAQTATTGVAMAFAVSATGHPEPVLALQGTTVATGSYSFAAATGHLDYTPTETDLGTNHFTFTASNSVGAATQAVELVVVRRTNGIPATDLFISEYVHGWSNNKAIEIYNGTGSAVDLGAGDYDLRVYMNGSVFHATINLSGTLSNGAVYVVANPEGAVVAPLADLKSTEMIFNGDDVVSLSKGGVNLDVLGVIGSTDAFGAYVTKVRQDTVYHGTTNYLSLEWNDFDVGTYTNLGWHRFVGGTGTRPVLNAIPAQSVQVGSQLVYTVSAFEPDGDAIAYACESTAAASTWSLNAGTGEFQYTPTLAQAGTVEFDFTAEDKDGPCLPATMTVTVSVAEGMATVSFGAARVTGNEEDAAELVLPVVISGATNAEFQVVLSGTALPGADFTCSTTSVVFTADGPVATNLILALLDDALPEGPESAKLTLHPLAGAIPGSNAAAVLFIRDDEAFSVVTANLSSGTDMVYRAEGERILEALAPDIVLIQEFRLPAGTTYRAWVDRIFGAQYHYMVESTDGDGAGARPNGIISRWPILASGEREDAWAGTRDIAWATIDLPGNRELHAVCANFQADAGNESNRVAEAQLVTNLVAEAGRPVSDYLLVGGTLNFQTRAEAAMYVLTNRVTDARRPANLEGFFETITDGLNAFDYLLPNPVLDARHRPVICHGHTFSNGMILDTRLTWSNGVPPPALAGDSGVTNMNHLAVMKVYEFDFRTVPPAAFEALPAGEARIDLGWSANPQTNDVVVVWNRDGQFSEPAGDIPEVGAPFAGGTVLYNGGSSPQPHDGLEECSTYHYQCWSVSGTNYSQGLTASAETPPPEAPAALRVDMTNVVDFTLAWSTNSRSAQFQLDVATNPAFVIGEDELGDYRVDFEGADETKPAYTTGTVSLAGLTWSLADALIGDTTNDWKQGERCARLKGSSNACMAMVEDLTNGLGDITFQHHRFSTDGQVDWRVEYSTDRGSNWVALAPDFRAPDEDVAGTYSNTVQVAGMVRIRIRPTTGEAGDRRLNIDEMVMTTHPRPMAGPYYIPGYSNRMVAGESQVVTGLTADTTYYCRLRTADGMCLSGNSATGMVTTRSEPADQAIDFPAIGEQWRTNVLTLAATASSGLPVAFIVGDGPATLSGGNQLTFGGTGEVCIVALQGGNGNWHAALDVTHCFQVREPAVPPDVRIGRIVSPGGGVGATVEVQSETGRTYRLEYTTNLLLLPAEWSQADVGEGTGESILLGDGETGDVKRYYRIVIP